jgi:hypothetical protein
MEKRANKFIRVFLSYLNQVVKDVACSIWATRIFIVLIKIKDTKYCFRYDNITEIPYLKNIPKIFQEYFKNILKIFMQNNQALK